MIFDAKNVGQRTKADCQPEAGYNCRANCESVSLTEGNKYPEAEGESGP